MQSKSRGRRSRTMFSALFLAANFTFCALPIQAQQYVPPDGMIIGGRPFQCAGVPTYLFPQLGDLGIATPQGIALNWGLFSQLLPVAQAFVYGHECAHDLFGASETQADCWSAAIGKQQVYIQEYDLDAICAPTWWSPGDWTHAPGPVRCANINACWLNG